MASTLLRALAGLSVLGLGAFALWLGVAILPSRENAQEFGTIVPWWVTWGLVWLTAVIAVVIAATLVRAPQDVDPLG